MSYKDILVYIDGGASNPERLKSAIVLAKKHNARLTGITLSAIIPKHLKASDEKAMKNFCEQVAEQRIEAFKQACDERGVDSSNRIFKGEASSAARKLAQFARNFDLLILRQTNPDSRNAALVKEVAEQVILLSGRPIFLMPYIGANRMPCQKAMIAWDGTPAATRAVHDSLPIIKAVDEVIILVVREGKQKTAKGEDLADELATHLQRHDVNASVKAINSGTFDVPTVILNQIAENSIDLLVMGGYGTPHLKQKIFGGVTRTLLSSMITPVIMSH